MKLRAFVRHECANLSPAGRCFGQRKEPPCPVLAKPPRRCSCGGDAPFFERAVLPLAARRRGCAPVLKEYPREM